MPALSLFFFLSNIFSIMMLRLLWLLCVWQGLVSSKEHTEHAPHHPIRGEHYSEAGDHQNDFDHEAVLGKLCYYGILCFPTRHGPDFHPRGTHFI